MAMLVLTFGMTGARFAKFMDVIINGLPISDFLQALMYVLPIVLTYTLPWSILVAVMLVFGRLSADSEITAMRACGVSILQIVAPLMLIVVACTGFCLFMHLELSPIGYSKFRSLMDPENAMVMLEPNRPLIRDNMTIYFSDKIGKDKLKNIQIYVWDEKNPDRILQDITATDGRLQANNEEKVLSLILNNCLIINKADREVGRMFSDELKFDFDIGKQGGPKALFRREKFMSLSELLTYIRVQKKLVPRNRALECKLEIELNKRIAFALSPIAFLLLGIPLAIRTSRRETSMGLFFSVIMAGGFFLFIILAQELDNLPMLYPQYLLWIPNVIFQIGGAYFIYRISQR
jgi:lipopolysaccharide export system permease protein